MNSIVYRLQFCERCYHGCQEAAVSSPKKIEANRRNGAKSRGPVTESGKKKSSQNALKHGLRAEKMLVLSNESEANFDSLVTACETHFTPTNAFETELVQEIAAARWRLRRAWTVETNLIDEEMHKQSKELRERYGEFDEGTRIASAFRALADETNALNLVTRYETKLRRSFQTTLEILQKSRSPKDPNAAPASPPNPKLELPNEPNSSERDPAPKLKEGEAIIT